MPSREIFVLRVDLIIYRGSGMLKGVGSWWRGVGDLSPSLGTKGKAKSLVKVPRVEFRSHLFVFADFVPFFIFLQKLEYSATYPSEKLKCVQNVIKKAYSLKQKWFLFQYNFFFYCYTSI